MRSANPPVIIDVRTTEEYRAGHIPSSVNIPVFEMDEISLWHFDKDEHIYVYCKSGMRSAEAVSILTDLGFVNITNFQSIDSWPYGTTGETGWSIGNPDSTIEVVEYIDLECPYCAQAVLPHYRLFQQHADRVRFTFRHFPLNIHKKAEKAHAALEAAGKQGYFWDYRFSIPKYFYDLSDEHLMEIARFLELDMERFQADMLVSEDDIVRFVSDRIAGEFSGVSGTPTFFINGVRTGDPAQAVETILAGGMVKEVGEFPESGCREDNENDE